MLPVFFLFKSLDPNEQKNHHHHPTLHLYLDPKKLHGPGSYDVGGGFDPLVVPTLIDRQKRKVVVDSKVE